MQSEVSERQCPARFHVTSAKNRASISRSGLDWRLMGAARGIAGSDRPEQEGCFLAANEYECDWFVRMNNTGGPVDVWEVSGVDADSLVESPQGYYFFPGVVDRDRVRLVRRDIPPVNRR